MSIDEFLAFTADRPDEERWELVDGEAILNPSPSYGHQKVVGNLFYYLKSIEVSGASWEALPSLGVKLSDRSMPVPDVLVRPAVMIGGHFCDDMIVAFEVISPSSRVRDLRWKRYAYRALPSLRHYVVLHQNAITMCRFNRDDDWAEQQVTGPAASLNLTGIDVELPAKAIYAGTGLL